MCAMKYYEPNDKNQYKELRKNWKKEMKRPKPEFENHLKEYEANSSNQEITNNKPIDHEQEWKDKYEETVTYQIVRQKKQAEFTPKGKRRMIWRNILNYLTIMLIGYTIYKCMPVILYLLKY